MSMSFLSQLLGEGGGSGDGRSMSRRLEDASVASSDWQPTTPVADRPQSTSQTSGASSEALSPCPSSPATPSTNKSEVSSLFGSKDADVGESAAAVVSEEAPLSRRTASAATPLVDDEEFARQLQKELDADGGRRAKSRQTQKSDTAESSGPSKQTRIRSPSTATGSRELAGMTIFEQDGSWYQRQTRRCAVYADFPPCQACVGRVTGDLCRFIDLRVMPLAKPKGGRKVPAIGSFLKAHQARLASETASGVQFQYRTRTDLFPPMDDQSLAIIKATAAESLLDTMEEELRHASMPNTLWRRPEVESRSQCDQCLTSLFSASFICRSCGRDYCLDCAASLKNLPEQPPYPLKFRCLWSNTHVFEDLCPTTRLRRSELRDENEQMKEAASLLQSQCAAVIASDQPMGLAEHTPIDVLLAGPEVDQLVGGHSITEYPIDIDQTTFRTAWSRGEPIVVRGCLDLKHLGEHASARWGPESFMGRRYAQESCLVIRCEDDQVQEVPVSTFFSTLGESKVKKESTLGPGIWKLKDWPPSSAFETAFPELYRHFNAALPMPDYTRRDGRMNISAMFPINANVPDLGPKMYNAWPSTEDQNGKGSTRLHMDMADAVNIMYYAAKPLNPETLHPSHRPGVAAWDIFRAEDSHKLRNYLRETRSLKNEDDPIHTQKHFLDTVDRQRLWFQYGVRSWRIYQQQGDAVFIPAGCAHQVCNLTDCMKIAVDFVSPENVRRCFSLTAEFRSLNNSLLKSWKEDALQLKTMLWHAWRACRSLEGQEHDAAIVKEQCEITLDRPQPVLRKQKNSLFVRMTPASSGSRSSRATPRVKKSITSGDGQDDGSDCEVVDVAPRRNRGRSSSVKRSKAPRDMTGSGGEEQERVAQSSRMRTYRRSTSKRKNLNEQAAFDGLDLDSEVEAEGDDVAASSQTSPRKKPRTSAKRKAGSHRDDAGSLAISSLDHVHAAPILPSAEEVASIASSRSPCDPEYERIFNTLSEAVLDYSQLLQSVHEEMEATERQLTAVRERLSNQCVQVERVREGVQRSVDLFELLRTGGATRQQRQSNTGAGHIHVTSDEDEDEGADSIVVRARTKRRAK
ncbi:unnamed protein product [Parajaminaea phylloscopi]